MSHNKSFTSTLGVCSAIIGSSTYAIKAQRALAKEGIQSSVAKNTTSHGCIYTINFPCFQRDHAEAVLNASNIKIKGYL